MGLALAALLVLAADGSAQNAHDSNESGQFTLLGQLVDADSGEKLSGAFIGLTGTEWGSITNDEGRFRIPETVAGELALTVELLGYEKLEWFGDVADGDGLLVIELAPVPIVLEGLKVVTDRFRSRRNGAAVSALAYDAEDLSSTVAKTAVEFIEYNSAAWMTRCNGRRSDRCLIVRGRTVEPVVYVDERPVLGGLEYLEAFRPWELHMIEVFAGGRHIRAYTPAFMERAAKSRMAPIALGF
jgi:hypothetical protein